MDKSSRLTWSLVLTILGVSAAVTVVAPFIATFAAISIIGLPITIYLMLAPLLFLLAFGTWLIGGGAGAGWRSYLGGLAVTLALLAIPPFIANMALDRSARLLSAEDRDQGTRPAHGGVIGLRYADLAFASKDRLACDGLCQRLLLNGVASRVLVAKQDLKTAPDPAFMAASFRMEKRDLCPEVSLPPGHDPIKLEGERQKGLAKRIDELMRLAIAGGNCLIADEAPLGTADTIVSFGRLHRGANDMSAGLSLMADAIRADRIAMHQKRDGTYSVTYRWTGIVMARLYPLYAPTVIIGAELRTSLGLARYSSKLNIEAVHYEEPDITGFFVDRLGFDLAKRTEHAEAATRALLEVALSRPVDAPAPVHLAESFFEDISRARRMTADDIALSRKLFEDGRFPISRNANFALQHAKEPPSGYFNAVAAAMMNRLRHLDQTGDGGAAPAWEKEAFHASNIFRALPREAVLNHRSDLEWLARRERLRVPAYQALIRLAEFGSEGGAILLWLIDDAKRFQETRDNKWQHPHLAALTGFCEMGASGKEYIPELFDRLDNGVIANWASYHRLVVHMLVSLGADTDSIRLHALERSRDAAEDRERVRLRFDREIARARKKVECYY